MQHGKLTSHYLGKTETLTLARLQAVAQALAAALVETKPDTAAFAAVPSAQAAAQMLRGEALPPYWQPGSTSPCHAHHSCAARNSPRGSP